MGKRRTALSVFRGRNRKAWTTLDFIMRSGGRKLWLAVALGVAAVLASVGLSALAGWFLVTCGIAGSIILVEVFRPAAAIRGLAMLRAGGRYGERLLGHDATLAALAALRGCELSRLLGAVRQGRIDAGKLRAGPVIDRIMAGIEALDGLILRQFLPAAALAALALFAGGGLAVLGLGAAAALAMGLSAGGFAVAAWAAWRSARPLIRAEARRRRLAARLEQSLHCRAELAVEGALVTEIDALAAQARRAQADEAAARHTAARAGFAAAALAVLAAGAALALGGANAALAALGFFAVLAFSDAVMQLLRGWQALGPVLIAARRIGGQAALPEPEAKPPAPIPAPVPISATMASGPATGLSLNGVTFTRTGAAAPVVHDVSLHLAAGQWLALTGPSGAGKSTLLALAAGLLRPQAGQITLDGHDLGLLTETAIRAQITLVPQRPALTSGTLAQNIALAGAGDPAHLLALAALPLSPERQLAERGAGISGGEAQRLAIARALARRPAFLLLDEPTAGLDAGTAAQMLRRIRAEMPQMGVVLASHRRADAAFCDSLFTLP